METTLNDDISSSNVDTFPGSNNRTEQHGDGEESEEESEVIWFKCIFKNLAFETRLQDIRMMGSFRQAIRRNRNCFKGKTILDLSSSMGVLGFVAVRSGAAKLIVHSESDDEADCAEKTAKMNGFGQETTVVQGKIEELILPMVDVILSDWMGECVFSMSRVSHFLLARDRFLKPGGIVLPSQISTHISAVNDTDGKYYCVDWWKGKTRGFDMSSCAKPALAEPEFRHVKKETVMARSVALLNYNMYEMTREDLDLTTNFALEMTQKGIVHAFFVYFVAEFSHPTFRRDRIAFSSGPATTHCSTWTPAMFYLDKEIAVDGGDRILGTFRLHFSNKEKIEDGKVKIKWFCEEDEKIRGCNDYRLL